MNERFEIKGFDFHCHIDLYPDPAGMAAQCARDKVVVLAVTTTPKAWPHNHKWAAESEYLQTSPGLHPELVGDRYEEVSLLEDCIAESRFVGEVGLDGSPQHRHNRDRQADVFRRALTRADSLGDRVISIHSRKAANDVVRLIREHTNPDRTLCVLHWFSGTARDVEDAVALGCHFSVNQQMLEYASGAAIARSLPEDRVLTETDGPFTTVGTRKAVPSDVVATVKRLASIRDVPVDELEQSLMRNSLRVFGFAGVTLSFGEHATS